MTEVENTTQPATAPTPVSAAVLEQSETPPAPPERVQTVGRRKRAVARVTMTLGRGAVTVNGKPLKNYFTVPRHQAVVESPLEATDARGSYDIRLRIRGGGVTGQAEAARLGVARALLAFDEERRQALRAKGLLTRDARVVERKKPGRPKARKRFQFSKR